MSKCLVINRIPLGEEGKLRRKHLEQVNAFATMGFDTYYIGYKDGKCYICHNDDREYVCDSNIHGFGSYIAMFKAAKLACDKYGSFHIAYMRMIPASPQLINCLRVIRKYCKKIVYEFPTYPYDGEYKNGKTNVVSLLSRYSDRICRKFLKIYVDLAVVLTDDVNEVFGIPAIVLRNGINVEEYKLKETSDKNIEILCMGKLQNWHGYDRLLNGAIKYKNDIGALPFKIHILGEGKARDSLIEQAKLGGLDETEVSFPGIIVGEKLDNYFDRCSFAVESLGLHRLNLKYSSTLKSREYLARGIPFIYSLDIPGIDETCDFCKKVPADESPVDFLDIMEWYNSLKSGVNIRMRQYAKDHYSWESQFQLILNRLNLRIE